VAVHRVVEFLVRHRSANIQAQVEMWFCIGGRL